MGRSLRSDFNRVNFAFPFDAIERLTILRLMRDNRAAAWMEGREARRSIQFLVENKESKLVRESETWGRHSKTNPNSSGNLSNLLCDRFQARYVNSLRFLLHDQLLASPEIDRSGDVGSYPCSTALEDVVRNSLEAELVPD